jgi:hypothetical protein
VSVHWIPEGKTMPELSALRVFNLRVFNLRLVKVPDAAPPYDCQIHGAHCAGQTVASAADVLPAALAPPALVPPALVPPALVPPVPLLPADPATARPRQLALVIVEVLAGVRPDRQLVPLATDRVRARIRGLAPHLASDRRPRIQRIVTSRPAARAVEMTVVANFGPRSRALAMRFEHVAARPAAPGWPARPARWLCTAIEAG